jgi:hypothetical protein
VRAGADSVLLTVGRRGRERDVRTDRATRA